eukprot:5243504-Heterocapsa_arctica.AAC.1
MERARRFRYARPGRPSGPGRGRSGRTFGRPLSSADRTMSCSRYMHAYIHTFMHSYIHTYVRT